MGKKRSLQPSTPNKVKVEVKDEIRKSQSISKISRHVYKQCISSLLLTLSADSEVDVARDRLKGALKELLHQSDTASSADSSDDGPPPEYKQLTKNV